MLEKVKSGIGRVGGVAIGIAVIEVIYISIYINKRCTVMFVGERNKFQRHFLPFYFYSLFHKPK